MLARPASRAPQALADAGDALGGSHDDGQVVPLRHVSRWVFAALWVAATAAIIVAFARAPISYGTVSRYLFSAQILHGLLNTILISVSTMLVAIVLGLVVALMRRSESRLVSAPAYFYIWFFRSMPTLLQLLIWYNLALVFPRIGIPGLFLAQTNRVMTPFVAALVGLGISTGAYMAEIFRAGLLAVDVGQVEAAASIGLTPWQAMRRVIFPQALRAIIPPTGNEFISLLKYSSLAYVIQYHELLFSAISVYSINLQVIELLLTVTCWYITLTTVASIGQHYLEKRVGRSVTDQDAGRLAARVRDNLLRIDHG